MARILITGMPGTGKSSVLEELARRGFRVVDTDEPGWREYRPYAEPPDELHRGEFIWVADRVARLLADDDPRHLFVGGTARNQAMLYDRFDAVVLLAAPAGVLLDRIARRTNNSYGKSDLERRMVLDDLRNVEPQLRAECAYELDASRPLLDVVRDLVTIAEGKAKR